MGLKEFNLDLHIHTCLSPCADVAMIPSAVMKEVRNRHLDAVGICDHNSAGNVVAFKKAGKQFGVTVFGGMEITSSEEVHVLVYFDDDEALLAMQERVFSTLQGKNDPDHFGMQLLVDENDTFTESEERLLIGATTMRLEEIVSMTERSGGISVASHVDRETFGIIGQLGFIPESLQVSALEVSPRYTGDGTSIAGKRDLPLITSSDAHYLYDIGRSFTTFVMEELSFSELKSTFKGLGGRKVLR